MKPTELLRTSKLTTPAHLVKARLIATGLSMRVLAAACGMAPARLSELLSGRRGTYADQFLVAENIRRLTGLRDFDEAYLFGELLVTKGAA